MPTSPGLIVTYNPPPEFFTQLDTFLAQLNHLILVDNGSNPEARHKLEQEEQHRKALTIIFNDANLGIATALNQGCQWALEQGFQHLFVFDQDSRPFPGMVETMVGIFAEHTEGDHLAVLAPVVIDPVVNIQALYLRPKNHWFYERVSCHGKVLENISFVITSGSLFNLAAYKDIGTFRDDFFIDYVDIEYCLRARQHGYSIMVACHALLEHRQGERQMRVLLGHGHYPTFHSPLRWYYSSRNRIPMLRRYAFRFPHWFFYEMMAVSYIMLKMLLFETRKVAKLRAFFLGTFDGLRGRMGPAPDSVLKALG